MAGFTERNRVMHRLRLCVFSVALAAVVMPATALLPDLRDSAAARSYKDYQCFTDEGGGRLRPCSANYKRANPDWRGGEQCYTDEGGGRMRPCSANYKRKQSK
jgi:hypothetical protein